MLSARNLCATSRTLLPKHINSPHSFTSRPSLTARNPPSWGSGLQCLWVWSTTGITRPLKSWYLTPAHPLRPLFLTLFSKVLPSAPLTEVVVVHHGNGRAEPGPLLGETVPKLQQGGVFFQYARNFHFDFVAQGLALWKERTEKQVSEGVLLLLLSVQPQPSAAISWLRDGPASAFPWLCGECLSLLILNILLL